MLVLAFIMPPSARAAQPTTNSLVVGTVPGFPAVTVPLPVVLRNTGAVVAAQFDLAYNSSKVTPGSTLPTSRLSNHMVRAREVAPGVRRVIAYSMANQAVPGTNGPVVTIPFTVAANEVVGSGPITPSNVVLANRDARAVPATAHAGAIFVQPIFREESGIVDFFMPSVPDQRYLIQATTNFANWVNISTNLAVDTFMQLVDLDGPFYPYRFYRSALFDTLLRGQIGGFGRAQDGRVSFRLTGFEGRSYIIQASTNLVQWGSVSTNVAVGGVINFIDSGAPSYPYRFYRVQSEQ
jgi:hypothetical protein